MHQNLINFVRDLYQTDQFIPLHAPSFGGNEKAYVTETIDSTFVSSVGEFVTRFENDIISYTGAGAAVATVNGTAALHAALYLAGVRPGDLVITQALTFVATCNALYHMGAEPVFLDVDDDTLGLSPTALDAWLSQYCDVTDEGAFYRATGQRVAAIVPMHTLGHPVHLGPMVEVAKRFNVPLVEDAAESLGSFYHGQHTGTFSDYSAISFNGNKVITTGGGGMVLTSAARGAHAKHLTTTAKVPHPYEFYHDEAGFNYRMPNLNAALGVAQLETLTKRLQDKRAIAMAYKAQFASDNDGFTFVDEPANCQSNFWLNAVLCPDKPAREQLLKELNDAGVMARPVWQLMHRLPMFANAIRGDLSVSEKIEATLVNLPSSPRGC